MANWDNPSLTTAYATFLTNMKDRDVDVATMAENPTGTIPTGYIRWNVTLRQFERWNTPLAGWNVLVLSTAGGGTNVPISLGSMATQNNSSVNIIGGTIRGLSVLELGNHLTVPSPGGDNLYDIGSGPARLRYGYFKSGLAIPVGTDKWIP